MQYLYHSDRSWTRNTSRFDSCTDWTISKLVLESFTTIRPDPEPCTSFYFQDSDFGEEKKLVIDEQDINEENNTCKLPHVLITFLHLTKLNLPLHPDEF